MLRSPIAFIRHIIGATMTLVLLICAVEVGLRARQFYQPAERQQQHFDPWVEPSWTTHHQLKPLHQYRSIHPDRGDDVILTINSFGMREREVLVPKPPGLFRILCLGDEAVLAYQTEWENTFCQKLEQNLQARTRLKVEVLNGGLPGACPLLSYLAYKHQFIKLQPDLVILNFDMSDVADDARYRRHTHMGENGEPLACMHPALIDKQPRRIEDIFMITRNSKEIFFELLGQQMYASSGQDLYSDRGRYRWTTDSNATAATNIALTLEPVNQLKTLVEIMPGHFAFAVVPAPWQISKKASDGPGVRSRYGIATNTKYETEHVFPMLKAYAQQHHITYFETAEEIATQLQVDQLYMTNSLRFSEDGHTLYAKLLANHILSTVPGLWSNKPIEPIPPRITHEQMRTNQ